MKSEIQSIEDKISHIEAMMAGHNKAPHHDIIEVISSDALQR